MNAVPKICHFYWGGSSPMPELMIFTILSFHRYNPDWQIIVYSTLQKNEDLGVNLFNPVYVGKDYFPLLESMPFVIIKKINISDYGIRRGIHSSMGSDLLRTNVLYYIGGIYCDFDVLWLKSINEIVNIDCIGNPLKFDATICLYQFKTGFHSIGVVIAKKNSRFIYLWMNYQRMIHKRLSYQLFGNELLNKKFHGLREIQSLLPGILALKYETFYPYSIYNLKQLYVDNDLSPLDNKNTLALHWFNAHPLTQDYLGNNYQPCSMTSILQNEGYI
jgi:hypothetical protein